MASPTWVAFTVRAGSGVSNQRAEKQTWGPKQSSPNGRRQRERYHKGNERCRLGCLETVLGMGGEAGRRMLLTGGTQGDSGNPQETLLWLSWEWPKGTQGSATRHPLPDLVPQGTRVGWTAPGGRHQCFIQGDTGVVHSGLLHLRHSSCPASCPLCQVQHLSLQFWLPPACQ